MSFDAILKPAVVENKCPAIFYCGEYFYKGTKDIIEDGSNCCFWHMVGSPTRWGVAHPLYDFQLEILEHLKKEKYLHILKSAKLGVTELFLRFILFKALTDTSWNGGQVGIIVGTRGDESRHMIERCKEILGDKFDYSQEYNTRSEFTINKTNIKSYPANNIDAIRSQPNMRFILVDEGAMFTIAIENQYTIKDAIQHYIGGADVYIAHISTAGSTPAGYFYDIIHEENSVYKKLQYTNPELYGLKPHKESGTTLYNKEALEKLKGDHSYQRNYCGEWGSGAGSVYDTTLVNEISSKRYNILNPKLNVNILAVDPSHGFGNSKTSSRFAILGCYRKDGIIYTSYMKEFKGISELEGQKQIHKAMSEGYDEVIVDQAAPGLITDLQNHGYKVKRGNFAPTVKSSWRSLVGDDITEPKYDERERNLDIAANLVHNKKVRIHPTHKILVEQLRSITRDSTGKANKKLHRFDLGDCFSMAVAELSKKQEKGTYFTEKVN